MPLFGFVLSELIGAAKESAEVNRKRASSGPVKVIVTNQPHSRRHTGVDPGFSALLAWLARPVRLGRVLRGRRRCHPSDARGFLLLSPMGVVEPYIIMDLQPTGPTSQPGSNCTIPQETYSCNVEADSHSAST